MWDDHYEDAMGSGSSKKAKYDNLGYAGYEGLDPNRAKNWHNYYDYDYKYPDWTDDGYYGGKYSSGYGGYGGYGWRYGNWHRKGDG